VCDKVLNFVGGGEIVLSGELSEVQMKIPWGYLAVDFDYLRPCIFLHNLNIQVATFHVLAGRYHLLPTACLLLQHELPLSEKYELAHSPASGLWQRVASLIPL